MQRSYLSSLSVFALALLLSGCAASIQTSANTTYQDASFGEQNLVSGGLAVLPVVAGEDVEGYRRPFGQSINAAVDSLNVESGMNVPILTWQETMQAINSAGITQEYQRAIEAYRTTAVLDNEFLTQFQEATNSRYALFLLLGNYKNQESSSYNFFTGWSKKETAGVTAFSQVWDTVQSDVVWEGATAVEAAAHSGAFQVMRDSQRNPHFLSRKAADALVTELFLATAR